MRSFLDRYLAGDCEAVWRELVAYGPAIRSSPILADAEAVAAETMRRAKTNVKTLLSVLTEIGYKFAYPIDIGPNVIWAFREPLLETESEVLQFEKKIGPLPLSLRAWYREVGEVYFGFDEEAEEEPLPKDWYKIFTRGYLDPLVVWSPEYTLNEVDAENGFVDDDGVVRYDVSMSPDYHQKENTSGGSPYCFAFPDAAADTKVLYAPYDVTFVEYLRLAFSWGGFPGFAQLRGELPASLKFLGEQMIQL